MDRVELGKTLGLEPFPVEAPDGVSPRCPAAHLHTERLQDHLPPARFTHTWPTRPAVSRRDHQPTRCLLPQPFSPLGNHPKNHRACLWGEKPTGGWEREALWLSISSDLPEPEPLWQLLGPGWGQASGQPGLARNPRSSPGARSRSSPPIPIRAGARSGGAQGGRRRGRGGSERDEQPYRRRYLYNRSDEFLIVA